MEETKKNKIYKISTIAILAMMFIFMCMNAEKSSFWYDELDWTVNSFAICDNLGGLLSQLAQDLFNLPLYYIVMFPIYKIVPYGELWLLLPNIILTVIGVWITGKTAKKIGGRKFGIISLIIASSSSVLMKNVAFELRPYACLFCFSALALYTYICRIEEPKSKKNNILYTIYLILLVYSHWFGILMIAFYFIIDVILWIRKKLPISIIWNYIVTGLSFLPWLIFLLMKTKKTDLNYWANIPTRDSFYKAISDLLSGNKLCITLFFISICILLIYLVVKNNNIKYKNKKALYIMLGGIVWILISTFVYSKYINQKGSLWVFRYFIEILPQMFIITAIPIYELLTLKITVNGKLLNIGINGINLNQIFAGVIAILLFQMIFTNYSNICAITSNQPYREVSSILVKKEIYKEDSAVISSVGQGYLTYYFQKRGYDLPQNAFEGITSNQIKKIVKNGNLVPKTKISGLNNEELLNYNTLYLFEINLSKFKQEFLDFINENYTLKETNSKYKIYTYVKK